MYDGFADSFALHAEGSAHNAHYDRPAVLGLLGDVAGCRILDVGCGSGLYAAELARLGAEVVGIERLVEPLPAQSMKDHFPDTYHQLTLEPFFIVFVLVKTPASAASEQ